MMRKVITDLSKHGRRAVEKFIGLGKGKTPQELPQVPKTRKFQPATFSAPARHAAQLSSKKSTILSRYFSNNVTPNLAQELRNSFQFRMHSGSFPLFGNYRGLSKRLSMYAFVTMGMATWSQLHQDEEGHDAIFDNIREIITRKQDRASSFDSPTSGVTEDQGIHNFEFGPMIAKGCSAAVYQARYRRTITDVCSDLSSDVDVLEEDEESLPLQEFSMESDIEVISEEDVESVAPQDFSVDMMSEGSDIEIIHEDSDIEIIGDDSQTSGSSADGTPSFVNLNQMPDFSHLPLHNSPESQPDNSFDLAIKMMFNYDIESVASAIWREMSNELIPAKMAEVHLQMNPWQNGTRARMKRLPPHPNIVDMQKAFVGDVPRLSSAFEQYPDALPERINPDGCGRNKTLFIVMKRYSQTLHEFLQQNTLGVREAMMLLTQLLEAVVHLQHNNMAHRDLKSDNILVEMDSSGQLHLVVTDFGCCLSDNTFGLRVPYLTLDTCKGGNGCLMAPEIANARPGIFSWLDYSSSDLWAVGAIAYEIFGACNPFYRNHYGDRLDSATYSLQQLPALPEHVPAEVQMLVYQMLSVDPKLRPSAESAANTLHLLLWSPPSWLHDLEDKVAMRRWLVSLTARVICAHTTYRRSIHDTETSLQALFLARLDKHNINDAIHILQNPYAM